MNAREHFAAPGQKTRIMRKNCSLINAKYKWSALSQDADSFASAGDPREIIIIVIGYSRQQFMAGWGDADVEQLLNWLEGHLDFINSTSIGKWAERCNLAVTTNIDLSKKSSYHSLRKSYQNTKANFKDHTGFGL